MNNLTSYTALPVLLSVGTQKAIQTFDVLMKT